MGFFNKMSEPVFLKKGSGLEERLERLRALEPLLNDEGKAKIRQDIRNLEAGMFGEKNIAFELENSHMPMYIIHDLYLRDGDLTSQIDYLVVTRKICFIIECKNLYGDIEIDSQGTFVRTMGFGNQKKREGIYSPITQNQRHMALLRKLRLEQSKGFLSRFLRDRSFEEDHRAIVVLANPKTVLDARYAKKEVKNQVIRADHLVDFVKEACRNSKAAELTDKELLNWAQSYLDMDEENETDYLKKYEGYRAVLGNEKRENGVRDARTRGAYGSGTRNDKSMGNHNSAGNRPVGNRKSSVNGVGTGYADGNGTRTRHGDSSGTEYEHEHGNGNGAGSCLSEEERESLIKELRSYRWNTSQAEGIKPYMVFNDKQMMDLLEKFPANGQELKKVFGFGDVKVEKYGAELIGILNKYRG